ncbi:MAG: hypothetical protein JEZ11_20010 [Desulfobacterales bacterium]|nr:hypothetical protein [Desulfobacterales bacterium]
MTISAVQSAISPEAQNVASDNSAMGKTEFLALLIAQLQNQDPLNPADSTEFTSQLAQFSSLEQMTNMNDALTGIGESLGVNNNFQAVTYIGKEVVAEGKSLLVDADGIDPILVSLDTDASTLNVNIYDHSGAFVRRIEAGSVEAGSHSLGWDGKNSLGNTVNEGWYSYEIQAEDSDGKAIDAQGFVSGTVSSVAYEGSVAYLNIGGRQVSMADVIEVTTVAGE